jgi:hypothetical protein
MNETTAKGAPLTRGERLQLMLAPEEIGAIDDFRFNNRMPSRAAAIRELMRRGLAAEGYAIDGQGSSRDFGVIDSNGVTRKDDGTEGSSK